MPAPSADADAELVAQVRAGDDAAFAELVARHRTKVLGTAARYARDAHQLDDLAQEIFLRAYRRLHQFRGDAPFAHWLARLTVTACYDFLRRERRVREQVPLESIEWEVADGSEDERARARAACETLARALPRLPAEDQLILTLYELEERSLREVAELTGWSVANVKTRAHRARTRLKTILENLL